MSDPWGSGWGNYAIKGIVEIQMPEPVSLLPQTAGWWFLLAAMGCALLYTSSKSVQRYWDNRYRRQACEQLNRLQKQFSAGNKAVAGQIPALIKATALQVYPRCHIAQLHGRDWEVFLDESYQGPSFSQNFSGLLSTLSYQQFTGSINEQFWSQLQLWIKTHQVDITLEPSDG